MVQSKEEKREYMLAYFAKPENREKKLAASSAWQKRNRAHINTYRKERYRTDPEFAKKRREQGSTWYAKNPERTRELKTAWWAAHPEKKRAGYQAWARANPEKVNTYGRNRRARKAAAPGDHTASDIKILKSILGNACLECGATENIAIDHIVPLARGGGNGPTNLQLLCIPCNSSKKCKRTDYRTKAQIRKITEAFQLMLEV